MGGDVGRVGAEVAEGTAVDAEEKGRCLISAQIAGRTVRPRRAALVLVQGAAGWHFVAGCNSINCRAPCHQGMCQGIAAIICKTNNDRVSHQGKERAAIVGVEVFALEGNSASRLNTVISREVVGNDIIPHAYESLNADLDACPAGRSVERKGVVCKEHMLASLCYPRTRVPSRVFACIHPAASITRLIG